MTEVTVEDVQAKLQLELCAGSQGLDRIIKRSDISRPGLEMAGYFNYYLADRIQLLGKTELTFFAQLKKEIKKIRMQKLCANTTPAIIVANKMDVPKELIEAAEVENIPVLKTDVPTTRFSGMLTNYLEGRLAPMTTMHGVLVDVYGVGVLITGKSGVGKSEIALELIKRGHRLVADDLVEVSEVAKNVLIGTPPKIIEHLLEIRGVGIIDIMNLLGASAIRRNKRILLNIDLETWNPDKMYERLGLDEVKLRIMDSEITKLTIPVRPGRNLAVIIEVAAMDYRMKRLGVNAAQEFSDRINSQIDDTIRSQTDGEENL